MSEPPLDGGPGQPAAGEPGDSSAPDYSSPDYNGAPDEAGEEGPRRAGAHRAGGRPTPPPPPPAGAPYWPQPDYQPDEPLKRPLIDTLPLRLLQAGAAVLLVAILIFVFVQLFGSKTTNKDAAPAATQKATGTATKTGSPATTSGAATTSGSVTPAKTSVPATTTGPATKPTAKPTKSATKAPTAKPTAKPTTAKPTTAKPTTVAPPPVAVKAPLLVLNNSRIHGLALVGKTTFEQGGWTVTGTGNFSGRLPQTTVYYSPGFKAAAETLVRQFPTVTAVLPRSAGLPGSAPLTVVLTRYFKP